MMRLDAFRLAVVAMLSLAAAHTHASCNSPAGDEGALVYANNLDTVVYCDGTNWTTLNGNSGGSGGATTLAGLSDVDTTGASSGKIIAYNGTSWVVSDSSAALTPAGSTGDIQFNTEGALAADTGQLYWDATSNRLGIGTGSPGSALHVVGDIAYTGVMSDVSDRRMKRDIQPINDIAAEWLMLLRPVTFRMKDEDRREYGFIAQDVQKVFPELVVDGQPLSLNYVGLIAPAVKTIQLLKRENEEQGDRIEALAEQNRLLRMQFKELLRDLRRTQRELARFTGQSDLY